MNKSILIGAAACAVTACTTSPATMDAPLPLQQSTSWTAPSAKSAPIETQWISALEDPALSGLVDEALLANPDLQSAEARVDRARALSQQARSALFPALSASVSANRSDDINGDTSRADLSAGLDASWEADVWGRLSDQTKGALRTAEAVEADYDAARHLLVANVARAYFLMIEADLLIGVEKTNLEALEETLGFVTQQYERGLRSGQDIALIRADVETARASLDLTTKAGRDARRALELILGRYPEAGFEITHTLPAYPGAPAADLPASMLERRPDLRSARLRIESAHASTRAARAALKPQLTLQGTIGTEGKGIANLLDPSSAVSTLLANAAAPLFDGGRRQAEIAVADADLDIAIAGYQTLALSAFSEVETQLDNGATFARQEERLELALEEARKALKFVQFRYEIGESDLLNVLSIQQRVSSLEAQLVSTQRVRLDQFVSLSLALGGSPL